MRNNFQWAVLALIAVTLFAVGYQIYRLTDNASTRVTVVGEATTQTSPDSAVIAFSVVTQNQTAVNAQAENARKSEAVIRAVRETAANADTEIKTSNYNLQPEQKYVYNKLPSIIGYEARNSVNVTISDLNQVGATIDAATRAGANSVEGISFVLRETSPARGAALGVATKQAMTKAEAIAESLGGRIVRVVETREGGAPNAQTPEREFFAGASNASVSYRQAPTTPVEAGSLNVRSQVVLIVDIEVER